MIIFLEKELYSREAITATVYHFSGDFYVSMGTCPESDDKYIVSIEKKVRDFSETELKHSFIKELTDQQVRLDLEARFGHIRNLIVEEAFKPVTKK